MRAAPNDIADFLLCAIDYGRTQAEQTSRWARSGIVQAPDGRAIRVRSSDA
jgi:hypothetical protein